MSTASSELISKLINMIESSQQEIVRLSAVQGLQNFVIFHLISNGGMGQLSDNALDQLRRLILKSREVALESSDPECLEPLVDMLLAALPGLDVRAH